MFDVIVHFANRASADEQRENLHRLGLPTAELAHVPTLVTRLSADLLSLFMKDPNVSSITSARVDVREYYRGHAFANQSRGASD